MGKAANTDIYNPSRGCLDGFGRPIEDLPKLPSCKYEHKEYGRSITISKDELEKGTYGYFNRNGKQFIRNYKRILKNGEGMTLLAILADKTIKAFHNVKSMRDLPKRMFSDG